MMAASNIQYSWTQFVPEIRKAHGWERAAIQTAFSIFVVVQTWCTPLVGHFIDRYGPRVLVLIGGVLTGLAWVVNSYATTLPGFYVARLSAVRCRGRVRDLHQQLVEVVSRTGGVWQPD
jgi:MFS family permease